MFNASFISGLPVQAHFWSRDDGKTGEELTGDGMASIAIAKLGVLATNPLRTPITLTGISDCWTRRAIPSNKSRAKRAR
jgi:hypothetical protein